ncbi:unnamed protein product [Caretta caretta]
MMSLLWTKSLLFILSIPCLCSSQPSPPLLHFSAFLDHSNKVFMPWGHDEEEMINFELQDWHAVDEENLKEDKSQDYQLLSLTEDETFTTMRFKR